MIQLPLIKFDDERVRRTRHTVIEPEARTLARSSDRATSHAAAEQLGEGAQAHRIKILATLERIGSATFEEVAQAAGLRDSQAWRRLSDLKNAGLVKPSGIERKGKSNRWQTVWMLAQIAGGKA